MFRPHEQNTHCFRPSRGDNHRQHNGMERIRIQMIRILLSLLCVNAAISAEPVRKATRPNSTDVTAAAMQLLSANCLSCHNAEKHKGGLDLSHRAGLLKGGEEGPVMVPGKPKESRLWTVLAADADPHMPPKKQLTVDDVELMRRWIAAGAKWDDAALARASAPRSVTLVTPPDSYQPVLALALSPDGKRLAIGRGRKIVLHEISGTNVALRAETEAHRDVVRSLTWSPDGQFLASGAFREIKVWEAASLNAKWAVASNLIGRVSALRFNPAGDLLIAADGDVASSGWLRTFNVADGSTSASWIAHSDTIMDLSVGPDGSHVATASADKLVKIWDLTSKKETAQLEHGGAVLGVGFNTNSAEVVTVSAEMQLKIWDVKTRESLVTIRGKKHAFNAVAWSSDGKLISAVDEDGGVVSYSNFKRHNGEQSDETATERKLGRWGEPLHAVTLTSDGQLIFAGGQDGTVYGVKSDGKLVAKIGPDGSMPSTPSIRRAKAHPAPSFIRDVLPALAKAGCAAGACHAKAEGQNGFKLSVFSYDPKADYAEIVKEARGRRVFPAAPTESLLLLKPTATLAHEGGERFAVGSETYKLLADWIRGGMIYQHTNEPALVSIHVEPREKTYRKKATQALRVQARYSDGSQRDVTRLCDFVAPEKEFAQVSEDGVIRVGTLSGENVVVARYMGFVDASRVLVPAERTLPAKRYASLPVHNFIDRLAWAQFQKLGLFPSDLCTDSEFLRRASLDTIGRLPTPDEARAFLAEPSADKRAKWIEQLLADPAFGDYWANKWADLLRPNPDRAGVKSIYVLDQWLREQFRANKPYDQFVRKILIAEGSNHRDGPAVVYRDRREPADLTTSFSQLFLGTRMECAKCHHHPNEKWSQSDFYQFAAFFGTVKQKGTALSPPISGGTEVFYFAPGRSVTHPVTDEVMTPRPPDGPVMSLSTNVDPRTALADWLTQPENPFFAKAAVNRVWASFFGRGFVQPVDDFRMSNPAVNEPLLEAVAADFVKQGYDLKQLMRTILGSRLYQLSSTPTELNATDTRNFSRSYRRRLPAEVLLDAVTDVTGVQDEFTGCPPGTRAIQTWSYKVKSQFMDAFGRPNSSSDCPCERDSRTSVVQSLHMMNSRALQSKLSHSEGFVRKLADSNRPPEDIVKELYLTAFSRWPTADELKKATAAYVGPEMTRRTATEDVLWALLNSAEFVFNH